METTAHTPGPWTESSDGWIEARGPLGPERICDPRCMAATPAGMAEMDANARLIAAAPALLDELIAAQAALAMVYAGRTNWRGHLATLETVSAAMKSARAAIASATSAEGGR